MSIFFTEKEETKIEALEVKVKELLKENQTLEYEKESIRSEYKFILAELGCEGEIWGNVIIKINKMSRVWTRYKDSVKKVVTKLEAEYEVKAQQSRARHQTEYLTKETELREKYSKLLEESNKRMAEICKVAARRADPPTTFNH